MTERIIRRRANLLHIIKQVPVNNRDKRIMDEAVVGGCVCAWRGAGGCNGKEKVERQD